MIQPVQLDPQDNFSIRVAAENKEHLAEARQFFRTKALGFWEAWVLIWDVKVSSLLLVYQCPR